MLAQVSTTYTVAHRIGEITGGALVSLALLAGVLKCWLIARRRTTSSACAYALMFVLLGWWTVSVSSLLRTLSVGSAPIWIAIATVGLLTVLVGVIVAVFGLADYGGHPEYSQGRKQAVWALVLAALQLLAAFVGATYLAVERALHETTATADGGTDAPLVFDDLNMRYRVPSRPYVRWDAAKSNPAATFGLLRTYPDVALMVIAERSPVDEDTSTAALAEIAKAKLVSASNATILEEQPYRVANMEGVRFTADAKRGQMALTYVFWVYAHHGYLYQFITYGDQAQRSRVRQDADMLVRRFEQVDPERHASGATSARFGSYRAERSGLTIDLSDTSWLKWEGFAKENPESEIGGLYGGVGGFLVTPALFEGTKPNLDALTQALLKDWGIEYPSPGITRLARIREQGMAGYAFEHRRTLDGTAYDYRIRVLRDETHGFLVGMWQRQDKAGIDARARELFARVRIGQLREVPAIADLPEPQRTAQARLHNRMGLFHYNARDYASALTHFRVAVAADVKERTYALNALRAFGELQKWKEGLAWLRQLGAPLRRDDELLSWEAWFLRQDDQRDAALAVYRDIFSREYRGDDDFKSFAALLAAAQRWTELTQACDRYLAKEARLDLRLEEARLLAEGRRHEAAAGVLEKAQKGIPFSPDVTWALLAQYDALGRQRQRLALVEALIANGFASADAYYVKGDAEAQLKWYGRAKASFEAALKHKPGDKETRQYLQEVSAVLGEGNNSAVKQALKPVPLPPELAERLAQLAIPPQPDYGADYLYWVQGIAFERGKRLASTTRQKVRIFDKSGVERFSTLAFDFDPLNESIYVNELLVKDASGNVISRGRPSDFYVVDRQDEMATHDKTLYVPVPSLEPGRVIELTLTRQELGEPKDLTFRAVALSGERPMGLRAVYYLGDVRELRQRSANGPGAQPISGGLLWRVERAPVYPQEPLRVAPSKAAAMLWLGDAKAEWPALVKEYWARLEPQMKPSAAVTAEAQRVTRGISAPADRVAALVRHVRDSLVYKPIEFGRRARIPNSASESLRRKYGDCKDHALLLQQLLLAVDLPAQLALVNAQGDVQPELPSLDQFDHMITYLPSGPAGPARFIDTTDKGLSASTVMPMGLSERAALLVDKEGGRFVRIGAYADGSSSVTVSREARIARGGSVSVSEEVTLGGYYAASLRSYLASLDATKHKEWGQGVLTNAERHARLSAFEIENVRDPERALVVRMSYELPQRCRAEGAGLRCALPAVWETRYLEAEAVADRRTPFALSYPLLLSAKTAVRAADGQGRVEISEDESQETSELVAWSLASRAAAPSAVLEFECRLRPGQRPAARYADYVRTLSQALRSAGRDAIWRPR